MIAPRLPTSEADLADWSVFADALMSAGEPFGELIAQELALPARPSLEDIAAYKARMAAWCPLPRERTAIAWSLGHARSLALPKPRVAMREQTYDSQLLARTAERLVTPQLSRLESINLAFTPDEGAPFDRLLAALPATCTQLVVQRPQNAAALVALMARLPPTITRLALAKLPMLDVRAAEAIIHDRFERVDILEVERNVGSAAFLHRTPLPIVEQALLATTSVEVRVSWRVGVSSHPRCTLGDGAGLVNPFENMGRMLPRAPLLELQNRHGLVPIRSQLADELPEKHGVFVRRGVHWTVIGGEPEIRVNDLLVSPTSVVALHDGARLRVDGKSWVFVSRDLESRFRELVENKARRHEQ